MLTLSATISIPPNCSLLVNNIIGINPEPSTRFEGTRLIALLLNRSVRSGGSYVRTHQ